MLFRVCLISILFFISCSVSPRYSGGGNYTKAKTKKTKSKTVNKGGVLRGVSSWYGPNFHGKLTANGEVYDMYELSAAHKSLPIPCYVKVTNLSNGKSLIVRVNDRGPFKKGRIIDLSYAAAKKLDIIEKGTAMVFVEAIEVK